MTDIKESSHSTDNPLVFRRTPRSLQSMTALELALLCWRHEMSYLYPDEMHRLHRDWFTSYKFTSDDILHAPNCIVELIDSNIKHLGRKLKNWMKVYLYSEICRYKNGDYKTEVILKLLKSIVIEPCDDIIGIKTARNCITGDTFDPLDQFKIACKYSLEADIERFWPMVSDNAPICLPKYYYWTCRMRNEFNKIPGDEEDSAVFRLISHDDRMICHSWTDVEFFWDKLKAHELISEPSLNCFFNERVTHNALSKLNRTQLEYVLTRIPNGIMKNLSKYDYTFEYALETWRLMKNLITCHQFFNILYGLWEEVYSYGREHFGCADILLHAIWLEAAPHMKSYVIDKHVERFFDDIFSFQFIQNYGYDLRFLRCLLNDTKFGLRTELWRRNWRKFIKLAAPDDFDKFLRTCLENDIDIAEFKDNVVLNFEDLRKDLKKLICAGFSREVMEYLGVFSSDENRIAQLRKRIIEWILSDICSFHDPRSMKKFTTTFIDCDYSAFDPEKLKKLFIPDNLSAFLRMVRINNLIYVKYVFDCFLSSNKKYLSEVKQLLWEHLLQIRRSDVFRSAYLRSWNTRNSLRERNEFLKWCAPCEREFRQALSVGDIFDVLRHPTGLLL